MSIGYLQAAISNMQDIERKCSVPASKEKTIIMEGVNISFGQDCMRTSHSEFKDFIIDYINDLNLLSEMASAFKQKLGKRLREAAEAEIIRSSKANAEALSTAHIILKGEDDE